MNEDVKVKFIDALLSGEYTQMGGQLRHNGMNCVNGVLCELAIQEKVFGIQRGTTHEGYFVELEFNLPRHFENMMPPDCVRYWADVSYQWTVNLMRLNDNGASFEQIAEWVKNGEQGLGDE